MDSVVPIARPAEPRPGPVLGPARDPVVDAALRASVLAEELAGLLGRLEVVGARDPWVRQARYRLADAADSCRRAGQELSAVVDDRTATAPRRQAMG